MKAIEDERFHIFAIDSVSEASSCLQECRPVRWMSAVATPRPRSTERCRPNSAVSVTSSERADSACGPPYASGFNPTYLDAVLLAPMLREDARRALLLEPSCCGRQPVSHRP